MARGWESKSVEAQQEDAATAKSPEKPRLTRQEADRVRNQESLRLSLSNIEAQLARSRTGVHREMLERAKVDLQYRIEKLGE
jgi:IS30 family transposase